MGIDGTSLKASAGKKTTCFYGDIENLCEERIHRAEEAERESQSSDKPTKLPSKARVAQALSKINQRYENRKQQREILRKEAKDGGMGSLTHPLPAKKVSNKFA